LSKEKREFYKRQKYIEDNLLERERDYNAS